MSKPCKYGHTLGRYKDNRCIECTHAANRRWRQKYPEEHRERFLRWARSNPEKNKRRARKTKLKAVYGITIERYHEMLKAQAGLCGICGEPIIPNKNQPAIDHDEKTGAVRSLTHTICNARLGHVEDVEFREKALRYLADHTW